MIRSLRKPLKNFLDKVPLVRLLSRTMGTAAPITIKNIVIQVLFGFNRFAYWPTHHSSVILAPRNILIGVGTAPGLSSGCYIQGAGKVFIGDYTIIAPNVGIISSNHVLGELSKTKPGEVRIGRYCWIGMNAVILPDVVLGDHVVVGAGSVVTKSYEEGYAVLGGNPAVVLKKLCRSECIEKKNEYEYVGYVEKKAFSKFRRYFLNV